MTQFECVVSADLFRRAMAACSTSDGRYYLHGVHVSPSPEGGAVLTATNGAFLITLHDPEGIVEGEGIILLNKQMKAALRASGILLEKRLLAVRAQSGSQKAFVADISTRGDGDDYSPYTAAAALIDEPDARVLAAQFGAVLIDANFPDWRKVIPTQMAPGAPLPVIDQKLLSRAAEALSVDRKLWSLRLTCTGNDPSYSPVMVTAVGAREVQGFAIVMPTRHPDAEITVPAWARPQVNPQAMAAE